MAADNLTVAAGRSKRRRRVSLVLAIVLVSVLTLTSVFSETCARTLGTVDRNNCASNMRQIGLAAIMYANTHGNAFPDSLKTIAETQDLGDYVFTCPADPTGGQTHPIATTQPGRATISGSYIWVGDTLRIDAPNDAVLLYEPLSNHENDRVNMFAIFSRHLNDGMNVLFADAHVEWLTPAEAETILKQAATGTRPIIYRSSGSAQP